jgi:translation initiation factor IF-2
MTLKYRIFALAKELDIDSKVLIQHCREAGVHVKDSPLSSVSPEERDQILSYIKGLSGQKSAPVETAEELMRTSREIVPDRQGKVRSIATKQAGPLSGRLHKSIHKGDDGGYADEGTDSDGSSISTDTADVATYDEPATDESPADVDVEATPVTAISHAEPTGTQTVDAPDSDAGATATVEVTEVKAKTTRPTGPVPSGGSAPAATVTPVSPPGSGSGGSPSAPTGTTGGPLSGMKPREQKTAPVPAGMSRGDYIPAAGTMMNRMKDMMRARGTVPDAPPSNKAKGGKSRPLPSLPTMATPPKSLPDPLAKRKDNTPSQQPELRLTPELLKSNSPLSEHLRKHAEKKGKKDVDLAAEEELKKKAGKGVGITESRDQRRQQRRRVRGPGEEEDAGARGGRYRMSRQRNRRNAPIEYKSRVEIPVPISLRDLSEAMGRPANEIIKVLFKQGKMVTINEVVDEDTALEIGMELGVELIVQRPTNDEDILQERVDFEYEDYELTPRAPIITILGHVDHGKTTLVDTLRKSNVVSTEAGGITQHIAAYQVDHNGRKLTFVDTPGHAAFGQMRARGANVTDIIVLVVAANDGVMPQTVECISHAKAAGVPIVVALNKVDLPDINEQRVLQELAAHEILTTEWGGEIEVVRTSGLKGIGIEDLFETLLLTADVNELKGNVDAPAHGVCLEAFRDEGRGTLSWMIVQQGTLRVGDVMLCGTTVGRVRAMYNDQDELVTEALPSTPVKVAGLEAMPSAGAHFFVMENIEDARSVAAKRIETGRNTVLSLKGGPRTLESIMSGEAGIKRLSVIIKADSPGSLEAIKGEINKMDHAEVRVDILHEGVGGVNESDIYLASASGAIVVAFHVIADDKAMHLAGEEGVEIRRYSIIYEVTKDIKQAMEGLLTPSKVQVTTGRILVLKTFEISRVGKVAGCRVLSGTVERNNRVNLIRDQKILNNYSLASLKREKDDVKEVREGFECGLRLDGFNDIKEGDLLESYRIDEVKRTLES